MFPRKEKTIRVIQKYVFWKVFKNPIKLLTSPFLVMFQTFFTQRTLKGILGTHRALKKRSKGTLALGHSRHLELGHSGTGALGHSKGTWALRHLDTRGTLFSRLFFFCLRVNWFIIILKILAKLSWNFQKYLYWWSFLWYSVRSCE